MEGAIEAIRNKEMDSCIASRVLSPREALPDRKGGT